MADRLLVTDDAANIAASETLFRNNLKAIGAGGP